MPETSRIRGLFKRLPRPQIPPELTASNALSGLAVLLSLIIAFSMGIDYIARPPETARSLSIVESKLSLDFWGIIFITFAVTSLLGTIFEFWPAGILGHGVLAVNYLAIGAGVMWSVISPWEGYGWNTGVIYLCFAIFHYLVADGCYDEWAKEWKDSPPPMQIDDGEFDGHSNL